MPQLAFVLWFADDKNSNLVTLNELLNDYNVALLTSMSGTGAQGGHFRKARFPEARAALILEDRPPLDVSQRAFVLWFADSSRRTNVGELNALLAGGWKVVRLVAMSDSAERGPDTPGGSAPYSRALAILQRPRQDAQPPTPG